MLNLRNYLFSLWTLAALLSLCIVTAWAEPAEYDGLIEPYEVIDVGSPTEGIVAKVAVERSSEIKQGQVLVQLESSLEQVSMEKAREMTNFIGEINLQKAQLAFAKRAHQRVDKLRAISAHDKDQAATDVSLTRHRLAKARENRRLALLELEKSRAVLARRTIKSPISGVVVERFVSPGEYVNNQPLLRVARIDPLRVEVIVPAQMFGKIVPGMTATIDPELPEYGQQTATVAIVDRVIDSASSTFGVRLDLPNPDLQMPSGLKCLVRFDIDFNPDQASSSPYRKSPDQARN